MNGKRSILEGYRISPFLLQVKHRPVRIHESRKKEVYHGGMKDVDRKMQAVIKQTVSKTIEIHLKVTAVRKHRIH